jgi:hypothetical protein
MPYGDILFYLKKSITSFSNGPTFFLQTIAKFPGLSRNISDMPYIGICTEPGIDYGSGAYRQLRVKIIFVAFFSCIS